MSAKVARSFSVQDRHPAAAVELAFAPAERDVYRTGDHSKLLLAPAERNISRSAGPRGNIALRGSADIRFRGLSYKHLAPLGRKRKSNLLLQFEAESAYATGYNQCTA